MIVYVESNFILELALLQEEAVHADQLLTLAERGRCRLAFPAFALTEPIWEIVARGATRRQLSTGLSLESDRLGRSSAYLDVVASIRSVSNSLRAIERDEQLMFDDVVERVLRTGDCISLDQAVIARSADDRARHLLTPADALVYASVMAHVTTQPAGEPKCFVSRDKRAFLRPPVIEELRGYNCSVVAHFIDAVRIVERQAA